MSKKVRIDELAQLIRQYLNEGKEYIDEEVKEVSTAMIKEAKGELRAKSPKNTGDYAQTWTVSTQTANNVYSKKLWNKKHYRLTHLLEFGHHKRNGTGWVKAQPHIRPTEKKFINKFEKELSNKIRRGK